AATVTGVQTCALPIWPGPKLPKPPNPPKSPGPKLRRRCLPCGHCPPTGRAYVECVDWECICCSYLELSVEHHDISFHRECQVPQIGRASCRERMMRLE